MIRTQQPYIDNKGVERPNLIKHWTDDSEHKTLLQVETGYYYDEAIDIYPCPYTYEEVDKPKEELEEEEKEQE